MKIKQNSYLDIDKLKIGDLLYTPELVKDGKILMFLKLKTFILIKIKNMINIQLF